MKYFENLVIISTIIIVFILYACKSINDIGTSKIRSDFTKNQNSLEDKKEGSNEILFYCKDDTINLNFTRNDKPIYYYVTGEFLECIVDHAFYGNRKYENQLLSYFELRLSKDDKLDIEFKDYPLRGSLIFEYLFMKAKNFKCQRANNNWTYYSYFEGLFIDMIESINGLKPSEYLNFKMNERKAEYVDLLSKDYDNNSCLSNLHRMRFEIFSEAYNSNLIILKSFGSR